MTAHSLSQFISEGHKGRRFPHDKRATILRKGKHVKKIIFTIIFLGSVLQAQFDNAGTSAANFLKIGVGGRGEGLAGAYTAQVQDASALYWNPAGIAYATQIQILFSQNRWIADMDHSFFGSIIPLGKLGNLGLSFTYLNMGEMVKTTELSPTGEGSFRASDFALGLGYGKKISDRFAVGLHAKVIRESISFSSATALAIDAGSQYSSSFMGMRIGMAITNFGTKMRLYGSDQQVDIDAYEDLDANPDVVARLQTENWSLPMSFRLGLSIKPLAYKMTETTLSFDYYDPRDLNPIYALGAEVKILQGLFLRVGSQYKYFRFSESLDDEKSSFELGKLIESNKDHGYVSMTAYGFGISSELFPLIPYKFQIDYSVSDMGLLGLVKRMTVSLTL